MSIHHPGVVPVLIRALVRHGMVVELRKLASCSRYWRWWIGETVRFTYLRYSSRTGELVTKYAWCEIFESPKSPKRVVRVSDGTNIEAKNTEPMYLFGLDRSRSSDFSVNMLLFEAHCGRRRILSRISAMVVCHRDWFGRIETLKYVGVSGRSLFTWSFKLAGILHYLDYIDLTQVNALYRHRTWKDWTGPVTFVRVSLNNPDYEQRIKALPQDLLVRCPVCQSINMVKRRMDRAESGECDVCTVRAMREFGISCLHSNRRSLAPH
jgi:hypothetical protein